MTDATTAQLLARARRLLAHEAGTPSASAADTCIALHHLIAVVEAQDARIAALEAARAPHGPPLEGTGPLPLERKGG